MTTTDQYGIRDRVPEGYTPVPAQRLVTVEDVRLYLAASHRPSELEPDLIARRFNAWLAAGRNAYAAADRDPEAGSKGSIHSTVMTWRYIIDSSLWLPTWHDRQRVQNDVRHHRQAKAKGQTNGHHPFGVVDLADLPGLVTALPTPPDKQAILEAYRMTLEALRK